MQNTWSHLLVIFGLTAPLVSASDLQTAAINVSTSTTTAIQSLSDSDLMQTATVDLPTFTTLVTMMSENPTVAPSPSDVESIFDPIPAISPTLSIVSDYEVPTPNPGSIGILNGIPTRILNDTINDTINETTNQSTPIFADTANPEGTEGINLHQAWNTSYPGPIHDGDWLKYLQIWDPVWWSQNLDSLRQSSCLCSDHDFLTNPQAKLAAWMNFEYYSHQSGAVYTLDWTCGPDPSSMSLHQRMTSAKGKTEHCWQAAGGEFAGDHPQRENIRGYYCDAKGELCVEAWRDGKRSFKFHGHKRNYDRDGVHTWSEVQPVVADKCRPICKDQFKMRFDDNNHHNPSFITTFYPAKPVDLTIQGD